ncbi:MAG: S1 RNA-binding domain-containing protein [Eggerthellaceae bacterium]
MLGEIAEPVPSCAIPLLASRPSILVEKIREVIGKGETIRGIQDSTGQASKFRKTARCISRPSTGGRSRARAAVEAIVKEPEVGEIYEGQVVGIQTFGAFVKLTPSKDGLLHISAWPTAASVGRGRAQRGRHRQGRGHRDGPEVRQDLFDRLDKPEAPEGSAPAPCSRPRGEGRRERSDRRPGAPTARRIRAMAARLVAVTRHYLIQSVHVSSLRGTDA